MSTSHSAIPGRLPGVVPFEQVVGEYGAPVLRLCRSMLAQADAEDAWAETFLAALTAYPGLPSDANLEAWLVTIARRKCIDLLRATARRATVSADDVDVGHQGNAVEDAAGLTDSGMGIERDTELWCALLGLPDKQRRSVAYHHLAGMPHAEVAEILGGSEAAVRRSAADGIAALRRRLTPPRGPDRPHLPDLPPGPDLRPRLDTQESR